MILVATGGRDYTMRPVDWLRLDALHFPETLPADARARRHRIEVESGGPCEEQLAEARAFAGPVTALYEGEADGADTCARAWAQSRGIPVRPHPADWKRHGLSAGPRRNATMLLAALEEASLLGELVTLVAFPGGDGTADMVHQAEARRLFSADVQVLDYREGPAQRWTADDVAAVMGDFERLTANGELAADSWEVAIMKRWLELGGVGMPLCSAHLWSRHGRVTLPASGCMYIGRKDLRHGIAASPLGNPFTKTDGADAAVLLERYREHLREACRLETRQRPYERPVLARLRILKPWTLLVCWCHATKPCHGTVVADAAQQLHAATALKAAGRELPAAHWSAYRTAKEAAG